MIGSFFKTRKNKTFNFQPRFYDERKEEMEKRYAQKKAELNQKDSSSISYQRNFKEQWRTNKKTSNFSKKSNLRLVVILVILFAIAYYILYK